MTRTGIPDKFDVNKWMRKSIKARAYIQEEALKRLHLEVAEHQDELAALNAAIEEL